MKKKLVIAIVLALMFTALTAIMVGAYDSNVIYSENFNGVTKANFTSNQKGKFKANVSANSSFDIVNDAFVLTGTAASAKEYPSATFEANTVAYTSNHYVLKFRFKVDHNLTGETALCVIGEPRANISYSGGTKTTNVIRAYVYANGKFMTRIGDNNVGITEKYDTITTTLDPKAWNEAEIEVDGSVKKVYFTINGTKKTYDIPEEIVPSLTYASTKFNIAQIYCGAASVYLDDVSLSYCVEEDKTAVDMVSTGMVERISQDFKNLDVKSFTKIDGTFIGADNFCLAINDMASVYDIKNGRFRLSAAGGKYPTVAFDKFTSDLISDHYIWNYRMKIEHDVAAGKKMMRIANLRYGGTDLFYAEIDSSGNVTVLKNSGDTAADAGVVATLTKGEYHDITVEVIGAEDKVIFSIDGVKKSESTITSDHKAKFTSKSVRFGFFQIWGQKANVLLDNAVIYYPYPEDNEPNSLISVDGEIIASEDFADAAKESFEKSGTSDVLGKFYANVDGQSAVFNVKNGKFIMTATGKGYPSVTFDGMAQNYKSNHYVLSYKIRIDHVGLKSGAEVVRIASPRVDGKDVFYAEVDSNGDVTVMRDQTLGTVAMLEQGKYYTVAVEVDGEGGVSKLSIDGTQVAEYPIADDVKGLITKKSLKFIMAQVWGVGAQISLDNCVLYYPTENREINLFPKGETVFSENFNKLKTSKFTKNTDGTFDYYKNFYTNAVNQKAKFSIKNGVFTMTATKTGGFPCFTFDGKTEDYKSNRYILSYKFKLDHNITSKGTQIARIANPRVGGKDVFYAEVDSDGNVTVMRDKSLGVVATISKGEYCAIGVAVDGKKGVTKFYINGHLIVEYPISADVKGLLTNKSLKFNMCQLWSVPAVASIDAGMVTYGTTYVVQIGDYYYVNGVRCETAPPTGTPAAYALTFAACAACGIAVMTKKKKKH